MKGWKLKVVVHREMVILLSFTHRHAVPNLTFMRNIKGDFFFVQYLGCCFQYNESKMIKMKIIKNNCLNIPSLTYIVWKREISTFFKISSFLCSKDRKSYRFDLADEVNIDRMIISRWTIPFRVMINVLITTKLFILYY